MADTDADKAEVLSDFFSSVFAREPNGDIPSLNKRSFVSESSDGYFDRETVRRLLVNINISKSQGPDQLHPKLLYELSSIICEPLSIVFNKSYNSEITGT